MSSLVSQHQVLPFVKPVSGAAKIDPNMVRGNDNTLMTALDAHDADATIHLQDSTFAAMPAAGTVGRKWMSVDGTAVRLFFDKGAAWNELNAFGSPLTITSTTQPQLTIAYDGSDYVTIGVDSTGAVAMGAVGAGAGFTMTGGPLTVGSTGIAFSNAAGQLTGVNQRFVELRTRQDAPITNADPRPGQGYIYLSSSAGASLPFTALGHIVFQTRPQSGFERGFWWFAQDPAVAVMNLGSGGNLTLGNDTLAASLGLRLDTAAARTRDVEYQTAGVTRWQLRCNNVAETGSDAGSNFQLRAFTDAGVNIDNTVVILRVAGGAMTIARPVSFSSSATSTSATAGVGYATGAGGTVTQLTSKATGVTLNCVVGQITLNAANLAADTTVSFTLTNSAIAATDLLLLNHVSAGTAGSYLLNAQAAAGSATVNVRNITTGALAEAIVLAFAVVKGVTS